MSDKFISELNRTRDLNSYDLIPISQGINNMELTATVSQIFGEDTQWQRFNFNNYYRHPDSANFPRYRKVGKVTYLSGTLFIPHVFGDATHNYQSVKVDTNAVHHNNDGSLYFRSNSNSFSCMRLDAAPERSVYFRNIVLTQRYVVDQLNYNPNDDYSIPLSTVVTLEIGSSGMLKIHSLSTLNEDYVPNHQSNPLTQLASILPKDSKFPSFNQVNVGLSTENNAITIPPYNETILVPEDIDTTKASDLGGFRIDLSGLHFVNSTRKENDYWTNRS
ncbi:MAG: hypothetical protein ACK48V_05420 [Crocinitomicaceae bacterium]|jgi:hypothetical protein